MNIISIFSEYQYHTFSMLCHQYKYFFNFLHIFFSYYNIKHNTCHYFLSLPPFSITKKILPLCATITLCVIPSHMERGPFSTFIYWAIISFTGNAIPVKTSVAVKANTPAFLITFLIQLFLLFIIILDFICLSKFSG